MKGIVEDTLMGGEGRHRFRIAIADHKANHIQDWNSSFDSIDILAGQGRENWLRANDSLNSKYLVFDRENAHQRYNHFIYEQRTGTLPYINREQKFEDTIVLLTNKTQLSVIESSISGRRSVINGINSGDV